MTRTASETLAGWSATLAAAAVPEPVLERAALHLLDTLGCAIAASATGVGVEARAVVAAQGGRPEAEVVGLAERLPAPLAALANGTLAHALDFDDTHPPSICHVSTVVGPAAMAMAQAREATGREALVAYVAGVEAVTRIGAATPGAFHARGFHPTGVGGVFGAALASARLLGLDADGTTAALGIAGSFTVGVLEFLGDGTTTKRLHAGGAAQAGVQASLLAAAGGEGPVAVLDGRDGVFAAHVGDPSAAALARAMDDLGERWETMAMAVKPFPCCHFLHGSLEALESLCAAHRLDPDAVARVEVTLAATAARMVAEPVAAKRRPRTPYDGKFSLPFVLGAMLVHGRVDVATFAPAVIADEAVARVAARVETTAVPTASVANPFGGRVVVELLDGTRLEAAVDHPRGSAAAPMSAAAIRAKFRANAALLLDDAMVSLHEERMLGLAAAPSARISPW